MPVKRRRLNDLFVVGKPLTVNDGKGEPVEVWLQKINPVQNEDALRRANSARATARTFGKNKTSDEYLMAVAEVEDFASREVLIDLAIAEELRLRRARVESEVASEEEWSKDEYLQGIVDAWEGTPDVPGLKERWAEDKDDPEASRVKADMDRFDAKVEELVKTERESLRRDFENAEDDAVLDRAVQRVLEQRATSAFIDEYEYWQIYYAVRDPDKHGDLYFESVEQVKTLEEKTKEPILAGYRELAVEVTEGKGLEETPGSSPSSEQSEPEATEEPSGPVVVSQ